MPLSGIICDNSYYIDIMVNMFHRLSQGRSYKNIARFLLRSILYSSLNFQENEAGSYMYVDNKVGGYITSQYNFIPVNLLNETYHLKFLQYLQVCD